VHPSPKPISCLASPGLDSSPLSPSPSSSSSFGLISSDCRHLVQRVSQQACHSFSSIFTLPLFYSRNQPLADSYSHSFFSLYCIAFQCTLRLLDNLAVISLSTANCLPAHLAQYRHHQPSP
jgi:hypothetical protein